MNEIFTFFTNQKILKPFMVSCVSTLSVHEIYNSLIHLNEDDAFF